MASNTIPPADTPLPTTANIFGPVPVTPTSTLTVNGAIFGAFSDGSTGTGEIDSFVRIQADPRESGFNTDSGNFQFDEKAGNFTRSIHLADVPLVTIGGVQYRQFALDINQNQSGIVSLDKLEIFEANVGNLDASNVFVPGSGATPGSFSVLHAGQNAELVYNLDSGGQVSVDLNAGLGTGSGHGDVTVDIPASVFDTKLGTNPYIVLFSQFGDVTPVNNGGFEEWFLPAVTFTAAPALSVAKSVTSVTDSNGDGLTGDAGDVISYKVTVSNTGNVILTPLTVTDPVGGGTLTSGATLLIGASDTFTESHTISASDTTAGRVVNTATATAPGASSSSSTATPVTSAHPALTVAKSVTSVTDSNGDGATGDAGDVISYKVTVSNTGNVILTPLTVTDPVGGGTLTSGATLAIGASDTFTESHTISASDTTAGRVVNTATATAPGASSSSSTSTPVTPVEPRLTIAKSVTSVTDSNHDGLIDTGDVISYKVTVSNTGNVILTGLTVTDPLAGGTLTSGATLLIGASDTFTPSHTISQSEVDNFGDPTIGSGSLVNTATATSNQTPPASSSASAPLTQLPGVNVEKLLSPDQTNWYFDSVVNDVFDSASFISSVTGIPIANLHLGIAPVAAAGDPVYAEVVVSNVGNVTDHNLKVTDNTNATPALSGITFTFSGSPTIVNLAPGASFLSDRVTATAVSGDNADVATVTGTFAQNGVPGSGSLKDVDAASYDPPGGNPVPPPDLPLPTTANIFGPVPVTPTSTLTVNGAIFGAFSDGSTGTGKIDSFVRIQADPRESGFNTDSGNFQFDEKAGNFTRSIHLADVPLVTIGGVQYRQFALDINQNQSGIVSLDKLEIFEANVGNLDASNVFVPGSGATPGSFSVLHAGQNAELVYNLDSRGQVSVDLNAGLGTGSGHGDVTVDIPASVFDTKLGTNPYIVLFSQFGDVTPVNNGGFEEWFLPAVTFTAAPALSVAKSVTSVTDSNGDGLTGDAGDVISYKVTVSNTGNVILTPLTVTDPVGGGTLTSGATLAIGASDTFTESHTISASDTTAGRVVNTATATAPNVSSSSSTATPVTSAHPALTVAKSVTSVTDSNGDGLTGDAGDVISYKVTVSNAGNVILTPLTVTDPVGGGTLTSGATLAIGASDTFTESHTISASDTTAGRVVNTATATAPNVSSSSSTATPVTSAHPALTVAKSVTSVTDSNGDGLTGDAGDVISYKVTVSNTGNVILTPLTVTDPVGGGTLTSGATLLIGASDTFTESHTISASDTTAGSVVNTATATAPNASSSSSTATPVTSAHPALTVAKSVTSVTDSNGDGLTGDAGDVISYKVTVSNTGNVILTPLTVTDPVGGGTLTSGATLLIGASDTFTESHTISASDTTAGSVVNTATATAPNASSSSSTATPVTSAHPALTVAKSVTSVTDSNGDGLTGDAGDVISYKVTVSNTGNVILTPLTVTDPVGGGTLTSGATLAIGASDTFTESHTISASDTTAGRVVNTATATAPNVSSSSSTATPVTSAHPALTVAKSVTSVTDSNGDGLTGDAGDVISYKVTVSNTGNVILTPLTVTDPVGGGTLTSGATLLIGASDTFTESHTISASDTTAGRVVNTATATAPNVSSSSSTATPVTSAHPALTVAKSVTSVTDSNGDGLTGDAGDVISYKVTVSNTGNVILTPLTVTDPVGGGTLTSGATLLIGASDTFTESHTISASDTTAGSVVNTATATAPNVSSSSSTATPVTSAHPALTVAKSVTSVTDSNGDGLTGDAGDVISYKVTVSNTGNVILTPLTVTDPVGGGTLTSGATLLIGASDTFTESHTISASDTTAGRVVNTATATAPNVSSSSSTATPVTSAHPALTVAKSVTSVTDSNGDGLTGDAGDVISYKVTVSNTGNVILTPLTVTDPVGGGTLTSGATLLIGASDTFTESHTISASDTTAGSVVNTATATAPNVSSSSSTATPVTSAHPALTVAKSVTSVTDSNGDGLIDTGDVISYKVTVSNTGNVILTGLTVTDPLAGGTLTSGATLAIGASDTFTPSHTISQSEVDNFGDPTIGSGSLVNTATATSNQTPSASSSASAPLTQLPGVNVEKLLSPDQTNWYFVSVQNDVFDSASFISIVTGIPIANLHLGIAPVAAAGDPVYAEVVVSNVGNVTDHDLKVTDNTNATPALSGITFTFSGSPTIADLAPGASFVSDRVTATAVSGDNADVATVTGTFAQNGVPGSGSLKDVDAAGYDPPGGSNSALQLISAIAAFHPNSSDLSNQQNTLLNTADNFLDASHLTAHPAV